MGVSLALISTECDTLSVGVAGVIDICSSVPCSLWRSPYKKIVNLTNVSGHKVLIEQDIEMIFVP